MIERDEIEKMVRVSIDEVETRIREKLNKGNERCLREFGISLDDFMEGLPLKRQPAE